MLMWIILITGALPFVILPVIVKHTQRFQLAPRLRRLFSDFYPSSIGAYFLLTDKALINEGFYSVFDAVSTEYPGVRLYLRFYVADKEKFTALASAIISDQPMENPSPRTVLELNTYFDNGNEISTNNSGLAGAPLDPPQKISRTFQFESSTASLLKLHRFFSSQSTAMPILPEKGAEFNFFKERLRNELSAQEQIGGLILDKEKGEYRPTWAGAFLMAWYTMWPISFLRRSYFRQRARRWLKQASV